MLDRRIRVVRLAHRRSAGDTGGLTGISGSRGHPGRHLRRGNDAQLGAAKVTEHRAVRDTSTALVTEQGETSYPEDEASLPYLRISI